MYKFIPFFLFCVIVAAITFNDFSDRPSGEEVSIQLEKTYGNVKVSRILKIHDGDTFNVDIDNWPIIIGKNISIRINNIDTPETTASNSKIRKLSQYATLELEKMLKSASVIELRNLKRDKYFRINANVFVDNVDVGQKLIDMGLAKQYDGGRKSVWSSSDYDKFNKTVK